MWDAKQPKLKFVGLGSLYQSDSSEFKILYFFGPIAGLDLC